MHGQRKSNLHVPNANYVPLGCVGARVGSLRLCVGSARLFGYQHVGISKAKWLRLGYTPTRRPNVTGFALQLNIGCRLFVCWGRWMPCVAVCWDSNVVNNSSRFISHNQTTNRLIALCQGVRLVLSYQWVSVSEIIVKFIKLVVRHNGS